MCARHWNFPSRKVLPAFAPYSDVIAFDSSTELPSRLFAAAGKLFEPRTPRLVAFIASAACSPSRRSSVTRRFAAGDPACEACEWAARIGAAVSADELPAVAEMTPRLAATAATRTRAIVIERFICEPFLVDWCRPCSATTPERFGPRRPGAAEPIDAGRRTTSV